MTSKKTSQLTLAIWLPLAVILTLSLGFTYWGVQQNYRLTANEPQVQITNDSLLDLANVPDLTELSALFKKIDVEKSYSTFIVIYDQNKKPVAGSGFLNDQLVSLPSGVFTAAQKTGDNRFTWQPNKNLRFAAVLKSFKGAQSGYILAARSLKETEKNERLLTEGAAATWLLSLIVSLLLSNSLAKFLAKNFSAHDHSHEQHTA